MNQQTTAAPDRDVDITWEKATCSLRSSHHPGLHPESAFMLAHEAALQAAAAVLRADGTWKIGRGFHYGILARVTAMEADDLSRAARAADELCAQFRDAVYGGAPAPEAQDLARMHNITRRLMNAAHAWLHEACPSLTLAPPPDG